MIKAFERGMLDLAGGHKKHPLMGGEGGYWEHLRTLRSLGIAQSVARHIKIKQRQRGYDEATFVESFVLLNGVGGDCLDDFEQPRGMVAWRRCWVLRSVATTGAKISVRVS